MKKRSKRRHSGGRVRAAEGVDARDVFAMLFRRIEVRLRTPPVAAIAPPNATATVIAPTSAAKTTSRHAARARYHVASSAGRESDQEVLRTDAGGQREQRGADQIRIRVAASAEEKRDGEDDQHERRDVAERAAAEEPDVREKRAERAGDRRR